jgi:hypothetical protein
MMMKKLSYILLSFIIVSCSSIKYLKDVKVTNNAKHYARVIEYQFKDEVKQKKGLEIAKYGYDNRTNLIENYDNKGLYLSYSFDSLNNVFEENFYEKIDSVSGLRKPSSRWELTYEKGLRVKTEFYEFENNNWKKDGERIFKYSLNDRGQILNIVTYDDGTIKDSTIFESIYNAPIEKLAFDFNRIGTLTTHYSSKEIRYTASGEIKDSITYIYDDQFRLTKKSSFAPGHKYATVITFKYDSLNNIIEKAQYFGDGGDLFYTSLYSYNDLGLRSSETYLDSQRKPKWIKEYKYH